MQFSVLTFIKYANHDHNFDFEIRITIRKKKILPKINQISPGTLAVV